MDTVFPAIPLLPEQLPPELKQDMSRTGQNPRYHGEGDVLTHTTMVFRALQDLEDYAAEPESIRQILSAAALLHDIGKILTTRMEFGQLVSPGHARIGADMARNLLWHTFGLCGTPENLQLRETVCQLIRYHSLPPYAIDDPDAGLRLRRCAANALLTPDFSIRRLCLLAEADARGRLCSDLPRMLDQIALCRDLAEESGVLDGAYPFPDDHTAYSWLSGRIISPDHPLYDDTWGEVILMSGLPGTGKDTWIRENCPDMPMISLDDIRLEFGISPLDNQDTVAQIARDRAKELLRCRRSFVWNATNLTALTRQKLVSLFTGYGASVRIVYLETTWAEQLRRNGSREHAVPRSVIESMLKKLSPPQRQEAHRVDWYCI